MEMNPYIVYVKTDDANRITAVNSSAFLRDTDGWTKIAEGYGDKHRHAQGNYFDQLIMDDRCIWRYKLVDGKAVERTQEEMDADYTPPEDVKTNAELQAENALLRAQIQSLADRGEFIEDCIAEMAMQVYA